MGDGKPGSRSSGGGTGDGGPHGRVAVGKGHRGGGQRAADGGRVREPWRGRTLGGSAWAGGGGDGGGGEGGLVQAAAAVSPSDSRR